MRGQCVRTYLVFVATEASLLVRKANDILSTTRNNNPSSPYSNVLKSLPYLFLFAL